jgi:transposase
VGRASVNRMVRRFRESGSVDPAPHSGGRITKVTPKAEKALREILDERPDATLPELVELLQRATRLAVSTSTMGRALARLGFTRKKRPSSRPSKVRRTFNVYATVFEPGRAPWTLAVSSSSTKRGPTSR